MTYSEVKKFNENIHLKIEKLKTEFNRMPDDEFFRRCKEYKAKRNALEAQIKDVSAITEKDFEQIRKEKEITEVFEKIEISGNVQEYVAIIRDLDTGIIEECFFPTKKSVYKFFAMMDIQYGVKLELIRIESN